MGFQHFEFRPGVFHIQDAMGVCMTLLCGKDRALLVDTGYGLEDVGAYVKTLTGSLTAKQKPKAPEASQGFIFLSSL